MNRSFKNTVVLKVDTENPQAEPIARAAGLIKAGGLVAFPTETVYGLGANALDEKAMARLHAVKSRPAGKPFTIHIAGTDGIEKIWGCRIGKAARALMDKFWPGPLTIILKSAKGRTVGFRMPDNAVALRLISEAGVPVAAPSANISGAPPPTSAEEVMKQLDGKIDMVIDGGMAALGIESTVIDITVPRLKILRQGAISEEELKKVYG